MAGSREVILRGLAQVHLNLQPVDQQIEFTKPLAYLGKQTVGGIIDRREALCPYALWEPGLIGKAIHDCKIASCEPGIKCVRLMPAPGT